MPQGDKPARFARYALYWAPKPDTPLAAFGRSWLGHDPERPDAVPERCDFGLAPLELERITRTPKRYGFHATILAPFHVPSSATLGDLEDHIRRFAANRKPIELGKLGIRALGHFLALMPASQPAAMTALHTECAFAFERFRAPLSDDERFRRSEGGLTPVEWLMLAQWGYPYMLSEYRFHLTLTGSLESEELETLQDQLTSTLRDVCAESVRVDSLCLFGDPGGGKPFQLLARYPLGA